MSTRHNTALASVLIDSALGGGFAPTSTWRYGTYMPPMPSLTAGRSKYHPVARIELTEDEKKRNAEIDAKNATKKAARKAAKGE